RAQPEPVGYPSRVRLRCGGAIVGPAGRACRPAAQPRAGRALRSRGGPDHRRRAARGTGAGGAGRAGPPPHRSSALGLRASWSPGHRHRARAVAAPHLGARVMRLVGAALVGFVAGRLIWVLLRPALTTPITTRQNWRGREVV